MPAQKEVSHVSVVYRDCGLARFERDVCGRDSGLGFQAADAQESARAARFKRIARAGRPVTALMRQVLCSS
ncbi:MAG: hypothetical protein JWO52_1812 [Gammaproteobacteria bacterium]|nr:hypothetical protein [Gammaproteobacteria bacterium]